MREIRLYGSEGGGAAKTALPTPITIRQEIRTSMPESHVPQVALSILIPVYNEAGNVVELHREIAQVLGDFADPYEVIFVDDGSTDGTARLLAEIQDRDPAHVRVAFLKRNCGQTAALSAALDLSRGAVLIPMDGDRQNDPADIPRLLAKLEEGSDVVSGWRRDRQDTLITRKVPSWLANRLVARISAAR
jgi:glycosyltransferase involved in cell wall biosynthesis